MIDQAVARLSGGAGPRRIFMLTVASLLAAATITFVAANEADAQIDSDGYVPIYST